MEIYRKDYTNYTNEIFESNKLTSNLPLLMLFQDKQQQL